MQMTKRWTLSVIYKGFSMNVFLKVSNDNYSFTSINNIPESYIVRCPKFSREVCKIWLFLFQRFILTLSATNLSSRALIPILNFHIQPSPLTSLFPPPPPIYHARSPRFISDVFCRCPVQAFH